LQRISGVAFATAKELRNYERKVEEAKKYDHRRLGKDLDLFSFHKEGTGFPFFHANGKIVLNILKNYLRSLLVEGGYQEVETPTMLSDDLWRQSGHYEHYHNHMYFSTVEEKHYALRPMNCPGALLLYKERPRSYRELPLRIAEFGHVHRFELSGVLHGLFRARAFTIDDGHVFCGQQNVEQEVANAIAMTYKVLKRFKFAEICVYLSTKPEKAMGDDELWSVATESLKKGLQSAGINFTINEGDGAFYGPKIEFAIKDSMDRLWQCGTIQLDFFQPINFDLSFINNKGEKERPVMIHRAIYGSFERFFGILLEHYKGALPFWLAPVQVRILTITDEQTPYAQQIKQLLKDHHIRVERDTSSDPISGKIKTAQLKKIPWMLVIGNKEVEQQTITLRLVNGKQQFGITQNQLIEMIKEAQNS
jgi:threonyl-tRNA synthetase